MNNQQYGEKSQQKFLKWDKLYIGAIPGFIVPLIVFFLTYLIRFNRYAFAEFIDILLFGKMILGFISLCVIANLILFYLFLNKKLYRAARGVILATLIYAIIIYLVRFLS